MGNLFAILSSKSSIGFFFFHFFCLIKLFFREDLGFILFFVLSSLSTFVLLSFYRRGIVRRFVATFYLCGGD